jgi:AAA15 family ATPase/GTPase
LLFETTFPPSYLANYTFDDISKRFKFYRFRQLEKFDRRESDFLLPPDGRNLPSVYLTHKSLKSTFKEILKKYNLKLMIDPDSNDIKVVKELEDIFITYPYQNLSDTFQRLIFYLSAILTNKNSIIAMEEPEAHAFPFYTKYLPELIALDDNNQYIIATHNPYFLLTLVEKTPKKDLAVYITYYEDYQTKVKKLSEKKLQDVLDLGLSTFFNLDVLLED